MFKQRIGKLLIYNRSQLNFPNLSIIAVCIFIILSTVINTNYLYIAPGSVKNLGSEISVNGETRTGQGGFHITSIISHRAKLFHYLLSNVMPGADLVPMLYTGTQDEQKEFAKNAMEKSKERASEIGQRGETEAVLAGDGAQVVKVMETSDAHEKLIEGDIIVKLNDTPIHDAHQLALKVKQLEIGASIKVNVLRKVDKEKKEKEFQFKLVTHKEHESVPALGIHMETHKKDIDTKHEIDINIKNITGGSGELMFALEIQDRLSEKDLTGGHKIAGTGVLNDYGHILSTGSTKQKVIAAERASMDYFIVPETSSDIAKKYAKNIKIVPVETMGDVKEYLTARELGM